MCLTFYYVAQTDYKLFKVSLRLADKLSLAGYWKFNTLLRDIRDFQDRLESLVQRAFVRLVIGNQWWGIS